MKTLLALIIAAACLAGAAIAETKAPAKKTAGEKAAVSLEAQLIALETSTWEAVKRKDAKSFADVCLPDCIEIWGDGTVLTIKEVLAQVPDTVLSDYKLEDFKIDFPTENTALVRYRAWAQVAYKGEAALPRWMLASAVWVKKNGAWKAALYQETPEPAPKLADTANVEKELIALEHDWAKAYLKGDAKALAHLEAEGWAYTNAEGEVFSKADDVADIASGDFKATVFDMADLKVKVFGDTAVVTGRQNVKATYKGKDASALYQITDVWQRLDGRWQAISSHVSKVVPPTPPNAAELSSQE